jgi:citrate lyase beta subunit
VPLVHEALQPTQAELDWATAVLLAADRAGGGPVLLEGRMVDKPVVDRARRIVDGAGPDQQPEAKEHADG